MTPQAILYQDPPVLPERPATERPPAKRPKRLHKTTSSVKPKKCALTPRDTQILLDLYTARYMTAVQIQALHWRLTYDHHTGPERACQRRLRQLYDAGLVRRIEPRIRVKEGKAPLIYAIDKRGAQVLIEQCGIDPATLASKPHSREENYPFLQHLLDLAACLEDGGDLHAKLLGDLGPR